MNSSVRKIVYSILPLAGLAFSGCQDAGREPETESNGKPVVFASIAPLAFVAEKIGGEEVEIRSLVGEADDPHDFSPTPKQLVALGNASAFLTTGMPYEEMLVEKLKDGARNLQIVDLTEGIDLLESACEFHHDHEEDAEASGEEEEEHEHHHHEHELDPHIWLSPPLLRKQVEGIVAAMSRAAPEHSARFEERARAVDAELAGLHAELAEKLAPKKEQTFYVYHGAFAYFADAYGLYQEAIEVGGRKPEQKRIYELIESAKDEGVRTILVQPQFDPDSAKTIAEAIGGKVVAVDPVAADVFATLRQIAAAISASNETGES